MAALAILRKVVQLDPDSKRCKELLKVISKKAKASNLYQRKQFESAEAMYSEAIALSPSHLLFLLPPILCGRAEARLSLLKYIDAAEDCSKALAQDDGIVNAYKIRGKCLHHLQLYEDSLRDLKRVIELSPKDRDAKTLLKTVEKCLSTCESENYYTTLGIERTASVEEVKTAYKKAARQWHPGRLM